MATLRAELVRLYCVTAAQNGVLYQTCETGVCELGEYVFLYLLCRLSWSLCRLGVVYVMQVPVMLVSVTAITPDCCSVNCQTAVSTAANAFPPSSQWRTQEFFFGGGVQQIQLRTEDRQNGDLGAVAP